MNPLKAAVVLAKQGTPEALAILDLLAGLVQQRDSLLDQNRHHVEQLVLTQREYDTLKIALQAKEGMLQQAEQQCNEQLVLLKQTKALLTDWVFYNDNKKNADLVRFSKNQLKELPK